LTLPVASVRRAGLLAIVSAALLLRLWHLSMPNQLYFDETAYLPSAVALLQGKNDPNPAIPQLGKMGMAAGMATWYAVEQHVLGGHSVARECIAWRWPGAVLGAATVALVYFVGESMFGWVVGLLAAGLLAIDWVHLVMSRVAMLDVYVTFFIVLGSWFTWLYVRSETRQNRWLWLACVAFALAVTSKWNALFAIVACLMTILWCKPLATDLRMRMWFMARLCLRGFLVLMVVYGSTYLPYLRANQWNISKTVTWYSMTNMFMFEYRYVDQYHDVHQNRYRSTWWHWPLDLRPCWLFFEHTAMAPDLAQPSLKWTDAQIEEANRLLPTTIGYASGIVVMGSPWIWWTFLPLWLWSCWQCRPRRDEPELSPDERRERDGLRMCVLLYALQVGFWCINPGFMYYMAVCSPFMSLIIARQLASWSRTRLGALAALCYVGMALALLVYFWPLLYASPVGMRSFWHRIWLSSWV
jgi:dolichyl-phosphate-mannose--protein O-mannosyl transferase